MIDIPGIGPLTAILAAADVGDGKGYQSSRDYAVSLGVVPRQHSSGDKQVLLGISKRDNRSLRTLLIQGARAALKFCNDKSDPLSLWIQSLIERRGFNKANVLAATGLKTKREAVEMGLKTLLSLSACFKSIKKLRKVKMQVFCNV